MPKRVNKKSLESLYTIDDLQALLTKADSICVHMEEKQQLLQQVETAAAVVNKIKAKLEQPLTDDDNREDEVSTAARRLPANAFAKNRGQLAKGAQG